jgi:serine/threonine protein kinase
VSSNPAPPDPKEIAGRYTIVKKLGAGAFGTVYKARDSRLDRMVAIKTIRLEGLAASQAGLKEMTDRFQREAKTAAKLKHPGIVTIHDYGEADGLTYIAMEFIDGIGIDHILAETGRMPIERAAALGAQIAEALDYAHAHGVVHRDIKPANIMIEPGDRVKVTDFGIAKPGDSAEHLTMTGSLLGTPSYMSPEQAKGQKLDGRSDLFSVGCVLYEMVAGKKAFRGESITALLFKIISEEPPSLREFDPKIPDEMLRIISKALQKSPDARYQSGKEMAEDLHAITRPGFVPTLRSAEVGTIDSPVPATIVSPPTSAGAPSAAPTVASAPTVAKGAPPAIAPTVLSPAAPSVTPPPLPPAARPASRPAAPAARKSGSGMGLVIGLGLVGLLLLAGVGVGGYVLFAKRSKAPEPEPTPVAETTPTPVPAPTAEENATQPSTAPAEATPGPIPAAPTPAAATPRPAAPTPAAPRNAATKTADTGTTSNPPEPEPPMAGGGSLDEYPPSLGPDGREVGEATARAYRNEGGGGIAGRRFAQRPKIPRDVAPAERPAIMTLAWVMHAQTAFHRANGRYGTLQELRQSGLLRLDVPFREGRFDRRGYSFQLKGGAQEYRMDATPVGGSGRPAYVDDNGYVLFDE